MTAPPPTAAPKPRRRWLQFSLRTLLLVTALLACVSAWLGYEYREGQRQYEAIAQVEKMWGTITYDDRPTANDWRRYCLGKWLPGRVRRVAFLNIPKRPTSFTFATRELLGSQQSEMRDMPILDLTPLAELEHLETLFLGFTQVTDLSPLTKLENLTAVDLSVTKVTPEQIEALQQALPNCHITRP